MATREYLVKKLNRGKGINETSCTTHVASFRKTTTYPTFGHIYEQCHNQAIAPLRDFYKHV